MTSAVKEVRMVLYIMWVWVFGLVFAGGLSELRFTRFVATASKSLQLLPRSRIPAERFGVRGSIRLLDRQVPRTSPEKAAERCRTPASPMPATTLLPQRGFESFFRFRR